MISRCAWFEFVMEEATEESASLKDTKRHIFRHTYISSGDDVDLRSVQKLAGHKDIKITTRHAHLSPARKLAAAVRLAEYREEQEKAEAKIRSFPA
jgi:site-specific recombinase XerD